MSVWIAAAACCIFIGSRCRRALARSLTHTCRNFDLSAAVAAPDAEAVKHRALPMRFVGAAPAAAAERKPGGGGGGGGHR